MDDAPLELPPPPAVPSRAPLPVLGLVAPVVLALVLYAVTGSPLSLLFALLGPLLALTSVLDGRIAGRRRLRRDEADRRSALDRVDAALDTRIAAARLTLEAEHPSPAVLAADPARWRTRPPRGGLVLGTAELVGERRVRGAAADDRERRLVDRSRRVADAPFVVPPGCSVAVCGPAPLASAFARAVAIARARAEGVTVLADVIDDEHQAAHEVVVRIAGASRAMVVHAAGAASALEGRSFRPAYVTAAGLAGAVAAGERAPTLAALLEAAPVAGGPLAAVFAVDGSGTPVVVDLADGPHAVLAGTTGSGKSALLSAWLLALAAAHPPSEIALLLVDCKGGAAFDPLRPLPHVAEVVTDLEPDEVDRAVEGLSAELRRRERLLRRAGVADASETSLARLVVVVDEYRALVERAPRLAAVFADVAARGRSLGVHLVIGTQRATGTVRDELLANCGLRIGLRMRDAGDSAGLLGRPDAASLPAGVPGAAVLVTEGEARRIRVALTTPAIVAACVERVAAARPGQRCAVPWHPPLPERLERAALPAADGVVLGLLDVPEEQAQPPLVWVPAAQPSLAVVGAPGSGRTSALELAAAGLAAPVVAPDAAAFWDALHDDRAALVVDDVERLLDALGPQHASAALERLAVRLRSASAPTVVAFRGPASWSGLPVRAVVGLFGGRLLLGLDPDDHVALGGSRALAATRMRPGRGEWRGHRAQVAVPDARAERRAAPVEPLPLADGPLLLISTAPAERRAQLAAAGVPTAERAGEPGVWTTSPALWQADWAVLSRLQSAVPLLVDRLTAAEARATGVAVALPPVTHPDDVVLVPPAAPPRRVRLPR